MKGEPINHTKIKVWAAALAALAAAVFPRAARSDSERPLRAVGRVELSVSLQPENHSISGQAQLTLAAKDKGTVGFLLNKDFQVRGVRMGSVPLTPVRRLFVESELSASYGTYGKWEGADALLWVVSLPKEAAKVKPQVLKVDYEGSLYAPPDDRRFSRENIAFEVAGTIGTEGVYLSPGAFWYPWVPDCPATYAVEVTLPVGWNCVTDGATVGATVGPDGKVHCDYKTVTPTTGVALAAGPYVVKSIRHKDVEVAAYFLPAQAELIDGYLKACPAYLDRYEELLGPYPFPRFVVVDNFLPSGYGFPGWTLMGSEVLRLPFIKATSLGHEILHNWLGNSLWVDYREGNWCEGLTTLLADYQYKLETDSAGAVQYRMNLLQEFAAYVDSSSDYPVERFAERQSPADRAIGYGKVMMIFLMLRDLVDAERPGLFDEVLRGVYANYRWKVVGWSTWEREFARKLGRDLKWFFDQWVHTPGAPALSLVEPKLEQSVDRWKLTFAVVTESQSTFGLKYLLPVRGYTDRGYMEWKVFVTEPRQKVGIGGFGQFRSVVLDPGFTLFRRLYPGEAPVVLADFFGDRSAVFVVPGAGAWAAECRKVAEGLKTEGQTIITDREFSESYAVRSFWVVGGPGVNAVWEDWPAPAEYMAALPAVKARWREESDTPPGLRFLGEDYRLGKLCATVVSAHPRAEGKVIVHTIFVPEADPVAGTRKLTHYGKYSYLLFDGEQNLRKEVGQAGGASPMAWVKP